MVPGVVEFDAGRRNSHTLEAEFYGHRAMNLRAVLRCNEVHLRAGGRGHAIRRHGKGGHQTNAQRY